MVMRSRYGNTNTGTTMRGGIDLTDPAVLVAEVDNLSGAELLARALAALERGRPRWHADPDLPCKKDPGLFTSGRANDRALAFTACGGCSHRERCLDFAVELGDFTDVVYGGTDGQVRRRLAKQRAATEGNP